MDGNISLQVEEINRIRSTAAGQNRELSYDEQVRIDRLNHEELLRVARCQSRIGSIGIEAKKSKFESTVSKAKDRWGAVKSGLYWAVAGVVSNIFGRAAQAARGLFTWISDKIHRRKKPKTERTLDTQHIPGFGAEKRFEDYNPDDKPDDQPVLSDTRRVPIAWERAIPENPNQPPTVTVCIDQGREGDSVSQAGYFNTEMGHAFLSLNYTKNDPITGEPRRFSVNMGFYPKGGFTGVSCCAAQVLKGLYVPGQLSNDDGHEYAVAKTFSVTNKDINKLLLFAQNYEKDGYNFIKRNCVSFAAEAAEHINLDAKELFNKVDLSADNGKVEIALAGMAGFVFNDMAQRQILDKLDRDDLSYQRLGQKMVNAEDIKRFEKTEFNMRMKGYTPGHTGESIRNERDAKLNSMKYEPEYETYANEPRNANEERKRKAEQRYKNCRKEFETLCSTLENHGLKNKTDIKSNIDAFRQYGNTILQGLDDCYRDAFGDEYDESSVYSEFEQKNNAVFRGTELINEFTKGLDDIYTKNFGRDSRLNIPFQHMVSVLNTMKNEYSLRYRHINEESILDYRYDKGSPLFNDTRDSMESRITMLGGKRSISFGGKTMGMFTTAELAGVIQSAEDLESAFLRRCRNSELASKKDLTSEEKREKKRLDREAGMLFDMASAQRVYAEKEHFDEDEIRFIFDRLPTGEKMTDCPPAVLPSNTYKTFALEHVFGGTRTKVKELGDQLTDKLIDEKDISSSPNRFSAVDDKLSVMYKELAKGFKEKIESGNEELACIMKVIKEHEAKELANRRNDYPDEESFNKKVAENATESFIDTLGRIYCQGFFDESLEKNYKRMSNSDLSDALQDECGINFKDIRSKMLTIQEFEDFRNSVRGRFGLEPEPSKVYPDIRREKNELLKLKEELKANPSNSDLQKGSERLYEAIVNSKEELAKFINERNEDKLKDMSAQDEAFCTEKISTIVSAERLLLLNGESRDKIVSMVGKDGKSFETMARNLGTTDDFGALLGKPDKEKLTGFVNGKSSLSLISECDRKGIWKASLNKEPQHSDKSVPQADKVSRKTAANGEHSAKDTLSGP